MSEPSLVQPEGVNAGSAEELSDERDPTSRDDVRGGGRVEGAPDKNPLVADADPEPGADPGLVGAPAVGPEGSSGQDEGNQ